MVPGNDGVYYDTGSLAMQFAKRLAGSFFEIAAGGPEEQPRHVGRHFNCVGRFGDVATTNKREG